MCVCCVLCAGRHGGALTLPAPPRLPQPGSVRARWSGRSARRRGACGRGRAARAAARAAPLLRAAKPSTLITSPLPRAPTSTAASSARCRRCAGLGFMRACEVWGEGAAAGGGQARAALRHPRAGPAPMHAGFLMRAAPVAVPPPAGIVPHSTQGVRGGARARPQAQALCRR